MPSTVTSVAGSRRRRASATASAGSTCPAVPPPASTTRSGCRRPGRLSLMPVRAADLRPRRRGPGPDPRTHAGPVPARARPAPRGRPVRRARRRRACPSADQGGQQRRAAVRHQRQRHAGDRQQPEHRTDVDQGLADDPGGRARRGEPDEEVVGAQRDADARRTPAARTAAAPRPCRSGRAPRR